MTQEQPRFDLVLREFVNRPEFEGMIIDYHQRTGGQLRDALVEVLSAYAMEFDDPYNLMTMVLRIAHKNSLAVPALGTRLAEVHKELSGGGRGNDVKWRDIMASVEGVAVSRTSDADILPEATYAPPAGRTKPKVDVAIVTVREDEFKAVLARIENRRSHAARNRYDLAEVQTPQGECAVAVCRCIDQGPSAAQTTTSNLIEDLDPPWILMVGIAGGFPDSDFTLGDVLVANRVHDFSITCALEGKSPELDIRGGPMHRDVENLVAHLPAETDRMPDWTTHAALRVQPPSEVIAARPASPRFYGPAAWQKRVHSSLRAQFDKEGKKVRQRLWPAHNASSPTLVKSATLAARWKKAARNAASVEMELIGAYDAVHSHGNRNRLLGIRGISDIVGYKRKPEWTPFACHAAASFAQALLLSGVLMEALKRAQSTGA